MADQVLCKGFSEPRVTTPADQVIIDQIRHDVSRQEQTPIAWFQGIRVRVQITACTHYLFEVLSHEREYMHMICCLPSPKNGVPQEPKLKGVKRHQKQTDDLVPFNVSDQC